jgi:hypothetical protein
LPSKTKRPVKVSNATAAAAAAPADGSHLKAPEDTACQAVNVAWLLLLLLLLLCPSAAPWRPADGLSQLDDGVTIISMALP